MNSQRHLLFLAHSANQGGAELCLDTTLRYLDRARYRASVVFPWEGPMAESARQLGFEVEIERLANWIFHGRGFWHYKNALLAAFPRVAHLVRRIRREKIELVYSNTAIIYEGALAARLAGVPHVWHIHEVLTPEHLVPRMLPLGWIVRLIRRGSDRVIFESHAARQIVGTTIPPDKSLVIHNSSRFLPAANGQVCEQATSSPLPCAQNRSGPVLAWVGRFSERKNPLLLLKAVQQLRHRDGLQVWLVGDGPLKPAIIEEIQQRGLGEICQVLPFQDDIRPVLEAADLLVLTSREESFGLVLVEAGACGRPVIATRSQGPAEIIQEGQTGFLVDQEDVVTLAERIDQLLSNPTFRQTLGEAAARHVAAEFSPVVNTRKLETVFETLLEPKAS